MNNQLLFYIVKRILLALLTIFIVITATFFIMHIVPGGPFTGEKAVSESVQAAMEAKYGLDKPLIVQYGTYLHDLIFNFDLGPSLKQKGREVTEIIADGFAVSAKLGLVAAAWGCLVGIILGCIAAIKRNTFVDRLIMVISTAFISMPSFIVGSLLLMIFACNLGWFPANGADSGGMFLPVLTLGLVPMANITRLTRSSMLEVLGQDYIRTAKAKGIASNKILFSHALKNAIIPDITYFGPLIASIVTGSLVVEQIFAVPGIGRAFVQSIVNRDYTVVMGTTIVLACLVVIMNLLSDILYKAVDPRIELK